LRQWAIQLQGYRPDSIAALAGSPYPLVVIDLARDANTDYFTAEDTAALHAAGTSVLAYFEIGSIEDFRPEYPGLRAGQPDLILNQWPEWPQEYFVRYWDERWWELVLRPRIDQALRAGFDGVYLDTPLAYSEIDLALVPGETRHSLGRRMADLVVRLSAYARSHRADLMVFPQNSPELRGYPGYPEAIDGIAIEELFFLATDRPCDLDYCAENLRHARALRAAGKTVLAIDYATRPENIRYARERYRAEGFAGYLSTVEVDRLSEAGQ
jgi:cysteinyl-tRNA synthetase